MPKQPVGQTGNQGRRVNIPGSEWQDLYKSL